MNRFKINRINYYILLSVLIHSFLFLFIKKQQDITDGKKIIPIEVIDNLLETGYGEETKRNKKLVKRPSLKEELQKAKKNNPLVQQKLFKEKRIKEKKPEQKKVTKDDKNQPIYREEIGSGSKEGIKDNEPEKGSLRGKGYIKVTCLNCVRPIYPPIALRRGAEGTPVVKVWINKMGNVYQTELIHRSGNKSIDNAAKKAALKSTFYPLEEETSITIEYDLKIR
tara:strand:- start:161 stop:832 length:672 start_codon:yes stop_codon:yes gene_type:complete